MEKPVGVTFNIGALQKMTSREVYGQTLVEMGKTNKDIIVMTADLARTNKTGLSQIHLLKPNIWFEMEVFDCQEL